MTTAPDLPPLPPASERQGDPGHDGAVERASAIRLLTLRTQGLTYAQIASEMGYADASGARHALIRALDRHETEAAADLRAVENLRLDASERLLRAIAGDQGGVVAERIRAVDALTRLSARRSRLNGIDAPVQVQVSAGAAAGMQDALAELADVIGVVPGEVVDVTDDTTPGEDPTDG